MHSAGKNAMGGGGGGRGQPAGAPGGPSLPASARGWVERVNMSSCAVWEAFWGADPTRKSEKESAVGARACDNHDPSRVRGAVFRWRGSRASPCGVRDAAAGGSQLMIKLGGWLAG